MFVELSLSLKKLKLLEVQPLKLQAMLIEV
jgi:hypothetical protein